MKHLRNATVIFLLITIFSPSVHAITLAECQALSLKNSHLIEAYENRIKASIAANNKDKSSLWPQLSATTEVDYRQYSGLSDLPNGFDGRVGGIFNVDLQKIISQYPRLSLLDVEKNRLVKKIAGYDLEKTVTQNYYKVYILLKKKYDYLEIKSYFEKHIKDIEILQSRGMDMKLDLTRAQVQLKSYFISLNNTNNEIANILTALNSQMNSNFKESDFSSMDALDETIIKSDQVIFDENTLGDVESKWADKIADTDQLKMEAVDLKIAKETYQQSKFYLVPTLQMGVDHSIDPIDSSVEAYRSYAALTFNIFNFGQKANEKKQQKYNYEYQKNIFEENKRKLKVQIDQLILDMENARIIYRNASDNLKSAAENRETAKIYYQQGKIKESDILNISSEYLSIRDVFYDALSNFLFKKTELDFLIKGIKL